MGPEAYMRRSSARQRGWQPARRATSSHGLNNKAQNRAENRHPCGMPRGFVNGAPMPVPKMARTCSWS
eukprot:11721299-Alexandrium_andersonii.AAC.1